jgi:hypothetical protein
MAPTTVEQLKYRDLLEAFIISLQLGEIPQMEVHSVGNGADPSMEGLATVKLCPEKAWTEKIRPRWRSRGRRGC